jgi:hypothetical protein
MQSNFKNAKPYENCKVVHIIITSLLRYEQAAYLSKYDPTARRSKQANEVRVR